MIFKLDKKRLFWGSTFLLLMLMFFILGFCTSQCTRSADIAAEDTAKHVSKADVLALIGKSSKLYTAEVTAKKTMHYTSDNSYDLELFGRTASIPVPMSHLEAYIPVAAKYKASIDLTEIDSTRINIVNDSTIMIVLPDPVIEETACTIEHEKEVLKREILARKMDDATYQRIVRQAKEDIWKDISEEQYKAIIETAKVSATDVLIPMLHSLHFTKIQIGYRTDLNTNSSSALLKRKKE